MFTALHQTGNSFAQTLLFTTFELLKTKTTIKMYDSSVKNLGIINIYFFFISSETFWYLEKP
jgi:hypothetical protein